MINTKASAVSAPTPGCVCKRCASGRFSTSCSMACVSSAIVEVRRSSNSSRSRRRRLAHGTNGNDQLLASGVPPQPLLAAQTFIQGYSLRLVHDPRARLHHPSQTAIFAFLGDHKHLWSRSQLRRSCREETDTTMITVLVLLWSESAITRRAPVPFAIQKTENVFA